MLTTRVNINMEATQDMSRAVSLSKAALKGLQISIQQKQQTLGIKTIVGSSWFTSSKTSNQNIEPHTNIPKVGGEGQS